MADSTDEKRADLIELSIVIKDKHRGPPVIRRLFYCHESGGLSQIPDMAIRGDAKETRLAQDIAHEIRREPFHTKD
jgi:hypothetical protein